MYIPNFNNCLYKERIVAKDCPRNYVSSNSFPYMFAWKNAYHHIDIDPKYYTYLDFSWEKGKNKKYYIFTVLSFDIATMAMLFIELLGPVLVFDMIKDKIFALTWITEQVPKKCIPKLLCILWQAILYTLM